MAGVGRGAGPARHEAAVLGRRRVRARRGAEEETERGNYKKKLATELERLDVVFCDLLLALGLLDEALGVPLEVDVLRRRRHVGTEDVALVGAEETARVLQLAAGPLGPGAVLVDDVNDVGAGEVPLELL